jgi:hypothetical protein
MKPLAPGIKLKDAPVDYKVMLRLVSLVERKQNQADLSKIADEIQAPLQAVYHALEDMAKAAYVGVSAFNPPVVTFEISGKVKVKLTKDARAFNTHLEAKVIRRAKTWPQVDINTRARHMEDGRACAEKLLALDHDHFAWKVAGCMARIGKDEVCKLAEQVIAEQEQITEQEGLFNRFFKLYCLRRNKLLDSNNGSPGAAC